MSLVSHSLFIRVIRRLPLFGRWIFSGPCLQPAIKRQYTVIEELCPKDSGPPPHVHEWQDEAIYLIEGEITFRAGDQTIHAQAGSFVSIPRGTIHSFRVDSETARILNFYTPADLDRVIMMTGTPAQSRTLPPRGLPMQHDPQQQQELARRLLDLASQTFVDTPDTLRS